MLFPSVWLRFLLAFTERAASSRPSRPEAGEAADHREHPEPQGSPALPPEPAGNDTESLLIGFIAFPLTSY